MFEIKHLIIYLVGVEDPYYTSSVGGAGAHQRVHPAYPELNREAQMRERLGLKIHTPIDEQVGRLGGHIRHS